MSKKSPHVVDRQELREIEERVEALQKLTREVEQDVRSLHSEFTAEMRRLTRVLTTLTKEPTWIERFHHFSRSLLGLKGWIKMVGLLVALIGFVSSWFSLYPRVSLILGPIPEGHAFKSNISVSNDSVFDLRDVWIGCRLGEISGAEIAPRPPDYWRKVRDTFSTQQRYIAYMSYVIGAGQKVTADSFCAINSKLSYVDVLLVVHFRYLFIPGRERIFRLTTVTRPNGSLEWMEEPYREYRKPEGL